MIVWRVQHEPTGIGPYRGWYGLKKQYPRAFELCDRLTDVPAEPDAWPMPHTDFENAGALGAWLQLDKLGPWKCAFATLEQLCSWFDHAWRTELAEAGFVVMQTRLIRGALVVHGHHQVAYSESELLEQSVVDWTIVANADRQQVAA